MQDPDGAQTRALCRRFADIRQFLMYAPLETPLTAGQRQEFLMWFNVFEAVLQRIGYEAFDQLLVTRALEAGAGDA